VRFTDGVKARLATAFAWAGSVGREIATFFVKALALLFLITGLSQAFDVSTGVVVWSYDPELVPSSPDVAAGAFVPILPSGEMLSPLCAIAPVSGVTSTENRYATYSTLARESAMIREFLAIAGRLLGREFHAHRRYTVREDSITQANVTEPGAFPAECEAAVHQATEAGLCVAIVYRSIEILAEETGAVMAHVVRLSRGCTFFPSEGSGVPRMPRLQPGGVATLALRTGMIRTEALKIPETTNP
jgi:hypothetical protein